MTEAEELENKLYEKYIAIKNQKKKEIRIKVKTRQNEKMELQAEETGKYFDPEKYWANEKRKEQLKKQVNEIFKNHNEEQNSIEEAVKLFCKEMNNVSQFYEVSVQKVMTGDYKSAKNDLKANQLKYGYHFIIKPKQQKKTTATSKKNNNPYSKALSIDELNKITAEEFAKRNMQSWYAHLAKLQVLQNKVKQVVSNEMDNKKKQLIKKNKKTEEIKTEKITTQEIKDAIGETRKDAKNITNEANLDLHTSEFVQFFIKDAKNMSKEAFNSKKKSATSTREHTRVNSSDRVYNIITPKNEILDTLEACDEFVEAFGDEYFSKRNEIIKDINDSNVLDDIDDLDSGINTDFEWETDEEVEEELVELEAEMEKENAVYNEQNRRDLLYVMEHARDKISTTDKGTTQYKYPFMATYTDENGNKKLGYTTLIDVNYVGFGSKGKEAVKSASTLNNAPNYFEVENDFNHGINVDPYKPVIKVSEVIVDGNSTGELTEELFLNGYLAINDEAKYPEYKQKQNASSLAYMKEVQIHNKENSHDFIKTDRQESELQTFLYWIKDIFGDNWKNILNQYNYEDLVIAKEKGVDTLSNKNVDSYKQNQISLGKYQKQIDNFANGSASAMANLAQHKAKLMFDKASKLANLKNVTPLHFEIPNGKLKVAKGITQASEIIEKMQKPSKAYKRIVPKSGQQILGDQIFNLDYIDITRIQEETVSNPEIVENNKESDYEVVKKVAQKRSSPVTRIYIRKSGLKPFLLPKKALKNLFIKNQYGDILAACFFQILVSNTPIDEPYSGLRKRKYYTSGRVSSYKDVVVNGIEVYGVNKTAEEIYQEKEANRQEKYYYERFEHVPDDSVVRNDWEFIYKGKVFRPTDSVFNGCFDKKADLNSIKVIRTVFQEHSFNSKIKSISFSYHNTNPRWEQLEYGGYQQNENSGPWQGQGKYGFQHGVKNHFTYQAPNGWLRLIEAQWNLCMEQGFDIKCVENFINAQGFNATEVGKEIIEQFNIKPREYDYKNFKVIGVIS